MNELVSIMMPAKNAGNFIGEAIESIVKQTYKNWELIIVDDKSTDATRPIAESYAQKDSRILVVQGDGICSGNARNKAIARSKGVYLANMDADDVAAPERIERQVDRARKHPFSVIGTNVSYTTCDLKVTKNSNFPEKNLEIRKGFNRIVNRMTLMPGTMLVTAELLLKNPYHDYYRYLVDWDLILRLSENPEVHFENIPEPLYFYRLNAGSMTFNCSLRNKYNLMVRYNELRRKRKKPEATSFAEFEGIMKKNAISHARYTFFRVLKFMQHSLWIMKHRMLSPE